MLKKFFLVLLKFISNVFIVVASLIIVWVISFYGIASMGRMSPNITQEKIKKIQLGMTQCDVIDILGAPLESYLTAVYDAKGKVKSNTIRFHYSYSKPGFLWDVEIYVTFDKNKKVIALGMQEGDIFFYNMYKNNTDQKAIINRDVFDRIIPREKVKFGFMGQVSNNAK